MSFPNLLAEIARAEVSQKTISDMCGIPYSTWAGKILGKYKGSFTLKEAIAIKKALEQVQGRKMPELEFLFYEKFEDPKED